LKVFETRYIDMIRECMKQETPFGVVLIKSGLEVGAPAEPEDVGCMAHIVHWDMEGLGILMLRTQGGERFRILATRVASNNRLEARIELFGEVGTDTITNTHMSCAKALKMVTDDINAKGKAQHGDAFESPFALPMQFDNASWVANRWCEILPIPLKARQKLLELDNAQSRLTIVHQYLQQHSII
jgi:Lon protease-like protein